MRYLPVWLHTPARGAQKKPCVRSTKKFQNGVGLEIVNKKKSVISSSHQYQGCSFLPNLEQYPLCRSP